VCVAVCCSVLQCVAVSHSCDVFEDISYMHECVAVRCSVLQCVAVCCSVVMYWRTPDIYTTASLRSTGPFAAATLTTPRDACFTNIPVILASIFSRKRTALPFCACRPVRIRSISSCLTPVHMEPNIPDSSARCHSLQKSCSVRTWSTSTFWLGSWMTFWMSAFRNLQSMQPFRSLCPFAL